MARPPLGLLETLRPWHGAGLLHVLLPEGQGASDAPAAPGADGAQSPVGHDGSDVPDMRGFPAACEAPDGLRDGLPARNAGHAGSVDRAGYGSGADPSFDPDAYDIPPDPMHDEAQAGGFPASAARLGAPGGGQPGFGPLPPPRAAHRPAVALAESAPPAPTGPSASPLPLQQWPTQWRDLFARTPQPAPVLWTYWALGLDLSGCADAARRDTLRRILGALQQPKGSNAFWPVAMPDTPAASLPADAESAPDAPNDAPNIGPDVVADTALFLAGLERIAPRLVVVMGSKALRAFAPDLRARPYQQIPWRGRLLIVLPDMDNLIAAPATVEAVIAYLRTALKPATR
ncbi:hypothetical protein RVX_R33430 [Nitratidesulfovibrio sp. HK-II]|uniref:hypothetical protein n=1 Tax=Nitratidesulfovibrio sp. HK-II TaxID=2009266 RepID=UPI000E2EC165|nr:hypothetical protein RVX_2500 [Nitratidesulfovibrio sp. HK-II]